MTNIFGPLTSSAAGTVIVAGTLVATIGAITAQAAGISGTVVVHDSPAVPWWWAAYCNRIYAERRAAEEKARLDVPSG
jgi:hypothetical protein